MFERGTKGGEHGHGIHGSSLEMESEHSNRTTCLLMEPTRATTGDVSKLSSTTRWSVRARRHCGRLSVSSIQSSVSGGSTAKSSCRGRPMTRPIRAPAVDRYERERGGHRHGPAARSAGEPVVRGTPSQRSGGSDPLHADTKKSSLSRWPSIGSSGSAVPCSGNGAAVQTAARRGLGGAEGTFGHGTDIRRGPGL